MFLGKGNSQFFCVKVINGKVTLFLSSQVHWEHAPRRRAGVEDLGCHLIRCPCTYINGNGNNVRLITSKGVDVAQVA